MPLRLHSFASSACPQGSAGLAAGFGTKSAAGLGLGLGPCATASGGTLAAGGGGLGAKGGLGLGLGLGAGPCGTAGNMAIGAKGAKAVAWTVGGTAASGHGIGLGLGLGLGAWGPVLLGLGIVGLGYCLYSNQDPKRGGDRRPKDELAAALNGIDL